MTVQEWLGDKNTLGQDIWERKYRFNNESFEEWLDRESAGNDGLKELIRQKKFLFGGRTLANRGTGKKGSYSNCYSRGFVEDNLEDLLHANTDIALTFKAQGGQGISLSKLRPKGCGINNGQFQSDGIVPFMEMYNTTTSSISQGGSRKGALIMSLDIWHKEAPEFITIKSESGRIEKANLSLEIDDEFMQYVKHYYETGEELTKIIRREYDGNEVEYEVTPIKLYKLMMEKAYDWAEPGCIFTTPFRNYNLMEFCDDYQIETCNPCGEQPLPKHGACNLGSINLSEFVVAPFTKHAQFDSSAFVEAIYIAIEALDEVLDENIPNHALDKQREMAYNYRNLGLGIMGAHDCMIKMGITYGSQESKDFMDWVMKLMFRNAVCASAYLAAQKGRFPKYSDAVLDSAIIKNHFTEQELVELGIREHGLRNCSLLSIAPSGSIGTMLNISTGCEPLFMISYQRKTESLKGEDHYYTVYSGIAQEYVDKFNTDTLSSYFNTAADIEWKDRVDLQSVLQKHVDTAISSTVNLPHDITLEEVEQLYLYAWEKKLKGITIYRDGCARTGILTDGSKKEESKEQTQFNHIVPVSRKTLGTTHGNTYHRRTACGSLYLTVNRDDEGNIVEMFVSTSKGGICQANIGAVNRMVSVALRSGVRVDEIADQLKGITCQACARLIAKGEKLDGISCADIIGKTLMEFAECDCGSCAGCKSEKTEAEAKSTVKSTVTSKAKCPECGETVAFEGGCAKCMSCGWSKCE